MEWPLGLFMITSVTFMKDPRADSSPERRPSRGGARDQFGPLTCSTEARRPLLPTKRAVLLGANISKWCAASCDNETGVPTGRSTSGWRLERVGVHASTLKQPRDQ